MKSIRNILIIAMILLFLGVFFCWYTWHKENLIPASFVFHANGDTTVLNFANGTTTVEPTEQYCLTHQENIIWAEKEDDYKNFVTIYFTNSSGSTKRLFDTTQLQEQTGCDWVDDITYTENGRMILTAKNDTAYSLYEYHPETNEFHCLSKDNVWSTFSINGQELIFTQIHEEGNRTESTIISYNLENGNYKTIGTGAFAVRLDEESYLCAREFGRELVKRDTARNTEMYFDTPKYYNHKSPIPFAPPFVSDSQTYALIYYYVTKGPNDEAYEAGIVNLNTGKLWPLPKYYHTVLLQLAPDLPFMIPGHSMYHLSDEP